MPSRPCEHSSPGVRHARSSTGPSPGACLTLPRDWDHSLQWVFPCHLHGGAGPGRMGVSGITRDAHASRAPGLLDGVPLPARRTIACPDWPPTLCAPRGARYPLSRLSPPFASFVATTAPCGRDGMSMRVMEGTGISYLRAWVVDDRGSFEPPDHVRGSHLRMRLFPASLPLEGRVAAAGWGSCHNPRCAPIDPHPRPLPSRGRGARRNTAHLPVIPAKAGISVWAGSVFARNGDPRFRGDDAVSGVR